MTELIDFQRSIASAVMQPLADGDRMRRRAVTADAQQAISLVKPNESLTSFERLEIYNRQYWFRLLGSLAEDFPGLQGVIGSSAFTRLSKKYLADCPSQSFSMRDLGSRLPQWIASNADEMAEIKDVAQLAEEMTQLEWAHVESFDAADWPALSTDAEIGPETALTLQPCLRLLQVSYPVDDFRLQVREILQRSANAVVRQHTSWQRKKSHSPIYLAVHRAEFNVHYRRLQREEFLLLQALQSGHVLGAAIEAAFNGSDVPADLWPQTLQTWFNLWMQMGWFCTPPATINQK